MKPKSCVECGLVAAEWWNEDLCNDCFKKLLQEKLDQEVEQ